MNAAENAWFFKGVYGIEASMDDDGYLANHSISIKLLSFS